MGLNKDMQDLTNNIKRAMIFYIPRSLFVNMKQNHLDELEHVGFLNTLFYIDSKGDPKPIVNGTEYMELLSKDKILKSNVFELLDLKERLDKNTFHYLIDDYFKELDSNVIATDVISKEAKKDTTNYEPQIQGYLDLQYNVLLEHQEEMKQKFGTWKSKFELDRIFSVLNNTSTKPKVDAKIVKTKDNTDSSEKTHVNKKHKNKVLMPSDEEVDNYLLETVFSIDFSIINNKKT